MTPFDFYVGYGGYLGSEGGVRFRFRFRLRGLSRASLRSREAWSREREEFRGDAPVSVS